MPRVVHHRLMLGASRDGFDADCFHLVTNRLRELQPSPGDGHQSSVSDCQPASGGTPTNPFSISTLPPPTVDAERSKIVTAALNRRHGVPVHSVSAVIQGSSRHP